MASEGDFTCFFLDCNRRSKDDCAISFKGVVDRTDQSFKHKCDVNNIIKSYVACGYTFENLVAECEARIFANAENFITIPEGVNSIADIAKIQEQAQDAFIRNIPASIRAEFGHDAYKFWKYASDPSNKEALLAKIRNIDYHGVPSVDKLEEVQGQVVNVEKNGGPEALK